MSFSSRVKKDILSLKFKDKCCKKAFFHGAIMGAEVTDKGITVKLSDAETADLITYIASTVFKIKEMEINEVNRGFCNMIQITFSLPTAERLLSAMDDGADTDTEISAIFTCNKCVSYFFCGMFCATGSMSDPEKSYSLELLIPSQQRARKIEEIFAKYTDLTPGMTQRKKGYGLFFRNADAVSGFLTLCQLSTIVFEFVNQQFSNQLRGDENRATNFVASNIQKAVAASAPQIQAIQKLIERDRFYLLPEELRQTAQLRLDNPELSLKALASLHTPPITKSGLSHRLEKIVRMAEEI